MPHWFTFAPLPSTSDIHVVPVEDTRDHDLSRDCWCDPDEDDEEPDVVIHIAHDHRDDYERNLRKPH